MPKYLYAGLKHGKVVFITSASNIKDAIIKLKPFKQVYKIEKIERIGKTTKSNKKGKVIRL